VSILGNELHIANITIATTVKHIFSVKKGFSVTISLVSIHKIAGSFVVYTEATLYNIIQQLTASKLYEKHKKKPHMSAAAFMLVF
jgi:hypothetical protein